MDKDKNQAILDFLLQCPQIQANPLFFNFLNAKDNNKQMLTVANDVSTNTPFVDGSVQKRYTFTIVDFKSLVYQAIPKVEGLSNENVDDMLQVQQLLDWVNEQAELRNFPDFGDNCHIDEMKTLSNYPVLNGVDTSVTPALAKYSMSIQIDYIDTSKVEWNK